MIKAIFFLILITSVKLFAGSLTCGKYNIGTIDLPNFVSECTESELAYTYKKEGDFSSIWISDISDPNRNLLDVLTPNNSIPADLKLFISSNRNDSGSIFSIIPTPKININLDLSSSIPETDSGNIILVAALADRLKLRSDSVNGVDGTSSSKLCGEAFLSGKLDEKAATLGLNTSLKSYWMNNHIPRGGTTCNDSDISFIYNTFSCPQGFSSSSSESIPFSRYLQKRKCYNGVSYSFIDKSLNCSQGLIDMGLVRDPAQTKESLLCQFGQPCDLVTEKREYPLSLYNLDPTSGKKPVFSGNITAFVYDYVSLDSSVTDLPINGRGGKADLNNLGPSVKYCYQIKDADNYPFEIYADYPIMSFYKINWQPFIQSPSANDGLIGTKKNGSSVIIKGLDTSVRYWIGKDNIIN